MDDENHYSKIKQWAEGKQKSQVISQSLFQKVTKEKLIIHSVNENSYAEVHETLWEADDAFKQPHGGACSIAVITSSLCSVVCTQHSAQTQLLHPTALPRQTRHKVNRVLSSKSYTSLLRSYVNHSIEAGCSNYYRSLVNDTVQTQAKQ